MSNQPTLISSDLHSFSNFMVQMYNFSFGLWNLSPCFVGWANLSPCFVGWAPLSGEPLWQSGGRLMKKGCLLVETSFLVVAPTGIEPVFHAWEACVLAARRKRRVEWNRLWGSPQNCK